MFIPRAKSMGIFFAIGLLRLKKSLPLLQRKRSIKLRPRIEFIIKI